MTHDQRPGEQTRNRRLRKKPACTSGLDLTEAAAKDQRSEGGTKHKQASNPSTSTIPKTIKMDPNDASTYPVSEEAVFSFGTSQEAIDSVLNNGKPGGYGQTSANAGFLPSATKMSEGNPQAPAKPTALLKKWPSVLMQLMNQNDDDEFEVVMQRIRTHPHEILIQGKNGGMNALHALCVRYPPTHVVEAILQARPEAAMVQNFSGETPLHLASYSASEEVQEVLLRAAPASAAIADMYGDCPLHFAARQGATYPLTELLLQAAPPSIHHRNKRGVTPFWLLPRSFLEVESLEDLDQSDDYSADWDLTVLFLRYSYFGVEEARKGPRAETFAEKPDYSWLVHAAAATPSCPRDVLKFFCRMFPEQALSYDKNGYTPLLLAAQAEEMQEPDWDENEDGFREHVEVVEGELRSGEQAEAPRERVELTNGDSDFLYSAVEVKVEASKDDSPSVIDILLEWCPKSAYYADKNCRLPLAHAIASGRSWRVVKSLLATCPRALEAQDLQTGMFMYQLAGIHSTEIDAVYTIVRSLPELLDRRYRSFQPARPS